MNKNTTVGGENTGNDDYYAILDIRRNANEKEIQQAYQSRQSNQQLSLIQGGSQSECNNSATEKLDEAYRVLGNAELREIYNSHGSAAVRFFLRVVDGEDEAVRASAKEHLGTFLALVREGLGPAGDVTGRLEAVGSSSGPGSLITSSTTGEALPKVIATPPPNDYGQMLFHSDLSELLEKRLKIPKGKSEILRRLSEVSKSLLVYGGSVYWYVRHCICGSTAEMEKPSNELSDQELAQFLSNYFDVLGWIDLKALFGKATMAKCCPAGRLRSIEDIKSLVFEGRQMLLSASDELYQGFPDNPPCCPYKHMGVHKMSDLLIHETEDNPAMIAELASFDDTLGPPISPTTPAPRACPAGRLIRVLNYLQYFVFKCKRGEFEMFFDERHPFEAFNIPGIPYSLDERKGSLQEAGDKVGFVVSRGREQINTPRQYYGKLGECLIGPCVFAGWERWIFVQKENKK